MVGKNYPSVLYEEGIHWIYAELKISIKNREVRPKFSKSLEELKLASFDGDIFKKKEVF